tara:strand:- start:1340 stop:2050 length:711 start_codon:yes stop_codon:yes gene_type:complete
MSYGLIHRPGIGFFYIDRSGNIYYDFEREAYINDLFRVILNQCMAYFFFQNKKMALHAACISKNNKAYLISGPSGSGKSSLAAMLSKDYKIISEDLSVIENMNTSYVYSSYPLIKLDPKIAEESLGIKNKIIYRKDKLNRIGYGLENKFLNEVKTEIKKCVFINWGSKNTITKLDAKNKFVKILQNSFKPIPYDIDKNSIKNLLENISIFSKNVEIIQINRVKGSYEIDVIKEILN